MLTEAVDQGEVRGERGGEEQPTSAYICEHTREKHSEDDAADKDAGGKGDTVTMVKEMALLEGVPFACVEKAIQSVEDPDGDAEREKRGRSQTDAVSSGEEPAPEHSNGGCIEREEVPEMKEPVLPANGDTGWCCTFRSGGDCQRSVRSAAFAPASQNEGSMSGKTPSRSSMAERRSSSCGVSLPLLSNESQQTFTSLN